MPDKEFGTYVDERATASALTGTEQVPVRQSGALKETTTADIAALAARPKLKTKSGDETVSASTTLQADDHLVVAVAADKLYTWDIWATVSITAAGDFKVQMDVPAGATGQWMIQWQTPDAANLPAGSADVTGRLWEDYGDVITVTGTNTHANMLVHIHGWIDTAATAGNLSFTWACNSASDSVTVKAGSWLVLFEVVAG